MTWWSGRWAESLEEALGGLVTRCWSGTAHRWDQRGGHLPPLTQTALNFTNPSSHNGGVINTHSQTNVFLLFTPTHPNAGTLVDTHNLTTVLIIPPWNKHKHFFFFYLKQPWLKFGDKISWGILFKVFDSTHNVSKQPHNCHHILIQMFLNSDWCTWMHDITPSQRSHPLKPVILPPATDTNGEKFCRDIT